MESFTAFIPINRCPLPCPWTPPVPSLDIGNYVGWHWSSLGMLSYGDYVRGSGLSNDPMLFTGGSAVSCKQGIILHHHHINSLVILLTEKKQPGVLWLLLWRVWVWRLCPSAAQQHPALVGGVWPLSVHGLCLLPPGLWQLGRVIKILRNIITTNIRRY